MSRLAPSPRKAAEMLKNPPGGKALTDKQEHFFQALKHGWKPTRLSKKKK